MQLALAMVIAYHDESPDQDPFDTCTDGMFFSDTGSAAKVTELVTDEFRGPCLESLLFSAIVVGLIFPLVVAVFNYDARR